MKKFDTLLSETARKFNVILTEEDTAMSPPAGETSTPPAPPADSAPMPQSGAAPVKPTYDKPYQDLAKILYKALRLDFDELESTLQEKILNLQPDNIKSDQQAVSIFREVERVLEEISGTTPNESGFGPGARL